MSAPSTAQGITVVGASAGSGKTTHLTKEVVEAIDPAKGRDALGLESLVAVTYTKKAASELASRIRQKLVKASAFEEALRLPLAYLGTVHSACLRLLQEFAIAAGLSPNVDVIADEAGRLLREALEFALTLEERTRLNELSERFELKWDNIAKRHNWLRPVADIMDLARSNRIEADALPAMAERSAKGLLALLPPPEPDGAALDAAFRTSLRATLDALAKIEDDTGTTEKARREIEQVHRQLASGEVIAWSRWAMLAKLGAGKTSDGALDGLRDSASRYERHPRFQAELGELTRAIFGAAAAGLTTYARWKEARQVVDYVDILVRSLDLVVHESVTAELAERLELVVVDEFQDTSPVQLALFVHLHKLAKRSVWVGDRKQCIYEYAGADPRLMDDITQWVAATGGTQQVLGRNYRSRYELVDLCSELFAAALERHGFTREEVVVQASRDVPPAVAKLPPLGLWVLEGKSKVTDTEALSAGVERMLAHPEATMVVDRATDETRPVRPGDIAILVATNEEATQIAEKLHRRGIRSAIARPGLLKTPEGVLVDAALRWLLDRRDTLAAARIDALLEFDGQDPDAWLDAQLATPERTTAEDLSAAARSWRLGLEPVRDRLALLSPCEVVDEVLRALDLVRLCLRWPDATQRVANLDALRGLVVEYEEHCAIDRAAGTVAGLLRFFDDIATPKLRKSEMLASDDQHVPTDDGAVVVMTYHRSKGLEWPVVILGSLDREERRTAFDVASESDAQAFDPTDPLAGRWIRYWPWPFGTTKKAPLADHAEASAEGQRVQQREERERARLLYVGFTRARDHLVLATRTRTKAATKKTPEIVTASCAWLDTLASGAGEPLLSLPVRASDGSIDERVTVGGGNETTTRVWRLAGEEPAEAEMPARTLRGFTRAEPTWSATVPYRILPSDAKHAWPEIAAEATIAETVRLPVRMPVDGEIAKRNELGDAVHGFFAADVDGLSMGERVERARRLLAARALLGNVRPEALVEASDRLKSFVAERWPGAVWRRELALGARVVLTGRHRQVGGAMDLLLDTSAGFVLFDHKTFPGTTEGAWLGAVQGYLPQFAAYARAVDALGTKPVVEAWVHLPVGGGAVRVNVRS